MDVKICVLALAIAIFSQVCCESVSKEKRADDVSLESLHVLIQQQAVVIQQQSALIQQQSADLHTLQATVTSQQADLASLKSQLQKKGMGPTYTFYFYLSPPPHTHTLSPLTLPPPDLFGSPLPPCDFCTSQRQVWFGYCFTPTDTKAY
jgi:hypothetical protein